MRFHGEVNRMSTSSVRCTLTLEGDDIDVTVREAGASEKEAFDAAIDKISELYWPEESEESALRAELVEARETIARLELAIDSVGRVA